MLLVAEEKVTLKLWDLESKNIRFDSSKRNFAKIDQNVCKKNSFAGCEYNPAQNGYLLVWGFTNIVQVWNPQFSMEDPFIGKYSEHGEIIADCKLLTNSPFVVSLDQRRVARVWDIKTFCTTQVVTVDDSLAPVTSILLYRNDNFLIYGKHLWLFSSENGAKREAFQKEIHPIFIDYNDYYKNFMVVTE